MARSQSRSTLLMFGCFLATVGRVICLQGGTLPAGSSLSDIAATDSPAIVIRCSSQQPELEQYAAQETGKLRRRLFADLVAIDGEEFFAIEVCLLVGYPAMNPAVAEDFDADDGRSSAIGNRVEAARFRRSTCTGDRRR